MYQHHIDNMTKNVVRALALDDTKYEVVKEAIAAEWEDSIATVWCVEDVLRTAQAAWRYIGHRDARYLLADVLNDHDAELGITWLTLDVYLEDHAGHCPLCGEAVEVLENGDARCTECDFLVADYLDGRAFDWEEE